MDCENCVFVLAIDYDVVCRGIGQKYGGDFDKKKGRSFFDKIIQVPFKMPITNYEIEKYIASSLKQMGFYDENAKIYVNVVSKSIGYNPRGLKRIFNAFLLLKMIYKDVHLDTPQKQTMLFAVLCLQMSYENIYNYIILNEDGNITVSLMNSLARADSEDGSEAEDFYEIVKQLESDADEDEIKDFMGVFCSAMTANGEGGITEEDMNTLREILLISGTTSSAIPNRTEGNGKTGKGVRYGNELDTVFSYHSIAENIEKTNAPAGWNGCEMDRFRLFGEERQATSFAQLITNVLAALYQKDSERFLQVRDDCERYKLYGLFYGSKAKDGLVASKEIPGTAIKVEMKNSNDQKIKFLRAIFTAMGYDQSSLELHIKLAHRV